jgi:4-hydroxy-tetrahydrodipicolinate synthase
VPVVVGTTHPGVIPATELSREAKAQGASAVMVAPPAGLKTPEAILAHYRAVAAGIQIPVVVQDEPVTTGFLMPASLLARIAEEIESCRIIKLEEAPTPPKVTQIRKLAGPSVKIFGGLGGAYFFEQLSRGAIRTAVVRAPGPTMDEVTRRELDDILRRMGVEVSG